MIDMIDAVSGCILAGLGVSPIETRIILDALWVYDPPDD
jgi:hypothetical protein